MDIDVKKVTPRNLWGIDLIEYLSNVSDKVDWIADGFLTDASITMLYATDGIGKSLIGIQGALELASGLPMFKSFHVEKEQKVIYCMAERSIKEPLKRIKTMIQDEDFSGKIKFENLTITTEFQGRDLSNKDQADALMGILREHIKVMGGCSMIFFDPLYALVRKDLKTDEAINGVFSFFRRIGTELGANVFFIHHENRGSRQEGESERTGQDYYGNKFISGLCTAVWHMMKDKGKDKFKTFIMNEKDSESCLVPRLGLTYNPEFNTVRADVSSSPKAKDILTDSCLTKFKEENREFTQEQFFITTGIQMHEASQRRFFADLIKTKRIVNIEAHGKKGIYRAV
jgi:RecA-family ATPase